jgi:hypothetical protein
MKHLQVSFNRAPKKGGKEEQRKKTQVWAKNAKTQSGSQRGKETNYVLKPPLVARTYQKRKGKRNLKV